MRRYFTLGAVIALGAACRQSRSTLALDVNFEPPNLLVKSLHIDVRQYDHSVVERRFAWQPEHAKLGIFLPDSVSGAVQVVGRGFDADDLPIAAGEGPGTVIPGGVSDTLQLTLRATSSTTAPEGGDPDGGSPDAGPSDDGSGEAGSDAADLADTPDEDRAPVDSLPTDTPTDVREGGSADVPRDVPDVPSDAVEPAVVTPDGLGRYCSMLFGPTGWAFAYGPNLTDDPCNYLRGLFSGGTVAHAGVYSLSGPNNVIVRCENASWIWTERGPGDRPLASSFTAADAPKHTNCAFVVSPRDLPIFKYPFLVSNKVKHITGVDFARPPYMILNLATDFAQPGAATDATVVNNRAQDRTGKGFIDDHDGHDLLVATGAEVAAVSDGTVLAARFRDVSTACDTRSTNSQGEVFIRHVLHAGTNSTEYDEVFVSYYAHLSDISVSVGQPVTQGQLIGLSGNTGCSTAPHLHLGVFRISNTADSYRFPFTINSNFDAGLDQNSSNGYQVLIDPYGFDPGPGPTGFDPWAWRAYPWGAMSINLWMNVQEPPLGEW